MAQCFTVAKKIFTCLIHNTSHGDQLRPILAECHSSEHNHLIASYNGQFTDAKESAILPTPSEYTKFYLKATAEYKMFFQSFPMMKER